MKKYKTNYQELKTSKLAFLRWLFVTSLGLLWTVTPLQAKSVGLGIFRSPAKTPSAEPIHLASVAKPEAPSATPEPEKKSQITQLSNLSRVALLVKENYVEPERIDPNLMLASILTTIEGRISKLVVQLPKSLKDALDASNKRSDALATPSSSTAAPAAPKAGEKATAKAPAPQPAKAAPAAKEVLVLDLGGVKKTFDFQPQRSLWGMIFFLRDIFAFLETEANKQGLVKKTPDAKDGISWTEIEYAAINGMLSRLDPHSVFIEPKYARDLALTTKGEFGGIGIVISVRDGFLTVISPIDGTPAALRGLRAKDRIVKIDGLSAINMDLNEAVNLLRGEPKTKVTIGVQRPDSKVPLEFVVERAIIKVESVAYAMLDENIGYLRIKSFNGKSGIDVRNGILELKKQSKGKLNGLVLSVEGNPGGLLREAIETAQIFLDGGEIVSTQGATKESREVEMASKGQLDPNLKIIILGDGGSASASEILIGALKYDNRAVFLGERTFGKGSVQLLFDFPGAPTDAGEKPVEPAALKLTIAQYFAPGNLTIQTKGIEPDIALIPVSVEKIDDLNLFPNTSTREADLDSHLLADHERAEENSLFKMQHVAPKPEDASAVYSDKLDVKKLNSIFAIRVAKELLKSAKNASREEILSHAKQVTERINAEEQTKIIALLKKNHIDWSAGPKTTSGSTLEAHVASSTVAKAGDKLKVSVKVKNTSDKPMYRVHGLTHAKTGLFDQREFLFGKINPGQEIERFVEFEISKEVISRKDFFTLDLRNQELEKLSELQVPLTINGLPRPQLSHVVYVDSKNTEADGAFKVGQDIDLVVWLKNTGAGKAFEPTILLKNESGNKVFLKTGRGQISALEPGQEGSARFQFRLTEALPSADFEMQIFDAQMQDIWQDKIKFSMDTKIALKKASGRKALKDKTASLYKGPSASSENLAELKKGVVLDVIAESGDFYKVNVATNLVGFVPKSELVASPSQTRIDHAKNRPFYTLNYQRVPPKVKLQFADGAGWTKNSEGQITADIENSAVSEVLLYVNGKKVLYKALTPSAGSSKVEQKVTLDPGVNIISLVAREDSVYGQRENITVFYDDKTNGVLFSEPAGKTPEVSTK